MEFGPIQREFHAQVKIFYINFPTSFASNTSIINSYYLFEIEFDSILKDVFEFCSSDYIHVLSLLSANADVFNVSLIIFSEIQKIPVNLRFLVFLPYWLDPRVAPVASVEAVCRLLHLLRSLE